MGVFGQIRKRDDRIVPFDPRKLVGALYRAQLGEGRSAAQSLSARSQAKSEDRADGVTEGAETPRETGAVRGARAGQPETFDENRVDELGVKENGLVDRALARELGAAVVHFAYERFGERIPSTAAVAELVEAVLVETGCVDIARAYVRHGEARSRLRDAMIVRKDPVREDRGWKEVQVEIPAETVAEAANDSPWNKRRIAESLVRRGGFDELEAASVAAHVEVHVIDLALNVVSSALLRELVNNELHRRGSSFRLRAAARRRAVARVLDQVFESARPRSPGALKQEIATNLLSEYSLDEIHSPAVREAHGTGWIHVHGLGDPLRLRSVGWDLPEPMSSSTLASTFSLGDDGTGDDEHLSEFWPELRNEDRRATSFLDLRELVERVDALRLYVSGEVLLRDPNVLLRDRALGTLSEDAAIRRVLESFLQRRDARPVLTLEFRLDASPESWLEVLLAWSQPGGKDAVPLRVLVDPVAVVGERSRHALALAADLHVRGYPVRFALQGTSTGESLADVFGVCEASEGATEACVGRVTLNLPQIAYRSGRRRAGGIEAELESAIDLAVKALLERRRFLVSLGGQRGLPLWDVLGRCRDAAGKGFLAIESLGAEVGLLGFAECVKFLTGCEIHESARAAERGRAILQTIALRLELDSRTLGIPLRLRETLCPVTLTRLETLDRERQTASVAEVDSGRRSTNAAETRVYSPGVRLHAGALVDHSRRLRHVAALSKFVTIEDLLVDVPSLRDEPPHLVVALLEELASQKRASSPTSTSDSVAPWSEWNSASRRHDRPGPLDALN